MANWRGRDQSSLKFADGKKWKNANMREGCVKPLEKSADVCYGWSLLTFFFLKAKVIREFTNLFVYAFIHEL